MFTKQLEIFRVSVLSVFNRELALIQRRVKEAHNYSGVIRAMN